MSYAMSAKKPAAAIRQISFSNDSSRFIFLSDKLQSVVELKFPLRLKRQTKVCRIFLVFLGRFRRPLNQFLITAAFALPKRVHGRWISGVLINRSIGRDDLSPTDRTRASAGGALLNIDVGQLALVVQFLFSGLVLLLARAAMTKSQNKDRTKDRNRRHQQHQGSNVQVANKSAVRPNRRAAHDTLRGRGFGPERAAGSDRQNHHEMHYRFARHVHACD